MKGEGTLSLREDVEDLSQTEMLPVLYTFLTIFFISWNE
jgi:hypothetical protein